MSFAQVIDGMKDAAAASDVDGALALILPVVHPCLFGEVADARTAAPFASKYREAKSSRSKDTFQLLCKLTTFQTQNQTLLQFIDGIQTAKEAGLNV